VNDELEALVGLTLEIDTLCVHFTGSVMIPELFWMQWETDRLCHCQELYLSYPPGSLGEGGGGLTLRLYIICLVLKIML
jgi:hypothetical protein